jgi:hypothetical protein
MCSGLNGTSTLAQDAAGEAAGPAGPGGPEAPGSAIGPSSAGRTSRALLMMAHMMMAVMPLVLTHSSFCSVAKLSASGAARRLHRSRWGRGSRRWRFRCCERLRKGGRAQRNVLYRTGTRAYLCLRHHMHSENMLLLTCCRR